MNQVLIVLDEGAEMLNDEELEIERAKASPELEVFPQGLEQPVWVLWLVVFSMFH